MKRKIALLILLLLALSVVFAACSSQPDPTAVQVRWGNETHTFRVTLADFEKYTQKNQINFFLNPVFGPTETSSLAGMDQVKPLGVAGTYTVTLSNSGSLCTATTEQTLYVKYADEFVLGKKISQTDGIKDLIIEDYAADAPSLVDASDAGKSIVVLKSTTKTEVVFENKPGQLPRTSTTEVDGFYIGKVHQQVSKYKVETTYDNDNHVATVAMNGEEDGTEYNIGSNVIDSNQLLLYVRSLDKSQNSFQDSPSVQIFHPLTGETVTASFTLVYNSPLLITDDTRKEAEKGVSVNSVAVYLNGTAYMLQENIPDYVKNNSDDKKIDYLTGSSANTDLYKFTTIHFRVGYLSYELAHYSDDQWNCLDYYDPDAEQ